ncbi:type III-B CRISPR module-associated protein Cmr3 [Persephonella sp. KM09-Lau-8]|uniref:type III-B CRISPR module-associated protein Cmr3 n=1 Tax=Persephonella sp. KM09-Lau-8 TaxID=1158345 RepID=UPI0004982239|nr:type III-B CRISPR module-associated protein Cmr3 [Persephonella sp. KM09-Lau-8]
MKILINPFDTLFFRDGKPFSLGEETIANTLSLPYPSTIYGTILSAYISQKNLPLTQETLNKLKDKLKIVQIALYDEVTKNLLYPAPYDLVYEKETSYSTLYPLYLNDNLLSNISLPKIPIFKEDSTIENFKGFIYQQDFRNYLLNNSNVINKASINEIINTEYKIGIGINQTTNSVEESKLYRIQLTRLRNEENIKIKIFVEFEGLDLNDEGYLKLGGENKIVYYQSLNENIDEGIKAINIDGNSSVFKLYLLTPAVFKNGYLAEWMNSKELQKFKPDWCNEEIKLKLLSISTGKYLSIGGFDLKEKRLKPMNRAIPEGTVYYFETTETDFNKIKKCFHFRSISDYKELRKQGFGITLVGNYINGGFN